jgi:hypothetical protein
MSKERLDALEAEQRRREMDYARASSKAEALKEELQGVMEELKGLGLKSVPEAQERIELLRSKSDELIDKALEVLDRD